MIDDQVEHEICGNCKRAIPQANYITHTTHCVRNITFCQVCRELFPKSEFENHKKRCVAVKPKVKKPEPPLTNLEKSQYFQHRKAIEDKKIAARKERQMQKYERLVDMGYSFRESLKYLKQTNITYEQQSQQPTKKSADLFACQFCNLELPNLALEEHENYCGTRTDICLKCGEPVMLKYMQIHIDSNHDSLLKDEPGPPDSWESSIQRTTTTEPTSPQLHLQASTPLCDRFQHLTLGYQPTSKEEDETYKDISMRPNYPAPFPPNRRPNSPTEIIIPCEFCDFPILEDDLIQHQTGCRPDLARYSPKRNLSPKRAD